MMIRARALTGFADLVAAAGGDAGTLLAAAGIPPTALAEPESILPLDPLAEMLDQAAHQLDLPDLGLMLSARQDIAVLGAVALVVRHSASVGEALLALERNLAYHSPGASLRIAPGPHPDTVEFRYDLKLGPGVPRRQAIELSYAIGLDFLRMAAPQEWGAWEVCFRHSAGPDPQAWRQRFGVTPCYGQPCDMIILPASVLARKIDTGNGALRDTIERAIRHAIRNHPLDIGAQVEALAARQLAHGHVTRVHIAGLLGLHERTLARRLAQQGLVFEELVDGVRRRGAQTMLAEGAIPLSALAGLLGYNGQSAFTRACKRWFGMSPGGVRRQRM